MLCQLRYVLCQLMPNAVPSYAKRTSAITGCLMGRCATLCQIRQPLLAVAGAIICSDAPGYDGGWMETLLAEGGQERGVRLADVAQLYGFPCRPLLDGLASLRGAERERAEARVRNLAREIVAGAEEAERLRPRVRHRALADADGLWWTWMAVQAGVARHLAEGGGR